MNLDEFSKIFSEQFQTCESVLIDKAKEYASDTDRMHNFNVAAILENITPKQALGGMMAKHTISVYDMIESEKLFTVGQWNEKITDHINYLILLKALVSEEAVNRSNNLASNSIVNTINQSTSASEGYPI